MLGPVSSYSMPELLLELGCEELPATFVRRAYTDLLAHIGNLLSEAGYPEVIGTGSALGTPRRLIVSFPDLPTRQPAITKQQRGPAIKSAYSDDGSPTGALLGFCRSQGVAVESLTRDDQYVWVTKTIPGVSTSELLADLLPKAIRSLAFDKTMRWGANRMRFARPIRWIVSLFDGIVVPFDVEGVASSHQSRGHRFYAPDNFEVTSLSDLLAKLRDRKVEPEASIRRESILSQARAIADGTPDLVETLVDENTFLTEWPTAIQGEFREEFKNLPTSVLVTAMAKHEKMFPVRDAQGNLTRRFIFIRNSGEDATVRAGCEWVLNARFNDAKFFFDEDAKSTLDQFLEKTATIVYQEKLGTVWQRSERLANLAEEIARLTGADADEIKFARQAALYAKADLSSGLVGELTSLQGIIGSEYARRESFPEAVCWAIATQYDPAKNAIPENAPGRTAVRLLLADQLDKLAGYLGLGLAPSGSSDPFALRRSATILIEAAWNWIGNLPSYDSLMTIALSLYAAQGVKLDAAAAQRSLIDVFASRYASLLPEVRYDILDAAISGSEWVTVPKAIRFRTQIITSLIQDPTFVQTATRPINIVLAAQKKEIEFGGGDPFTQLDPSALQSVEAMELLKVVTEQEDALAKAAVELDAVNVIGALKRLEQPINYFFDSTMVMVDDQNVRFARLTLVQACALQLNRAGDFSKIVIEG